LAVEWAAQAAARRKQLITLPGMMLATASDRSSLTISELLLSFSDWAAQAAAWRARS